MNRIKIWLSGTILPLAFMASPALAAVPAHPGMLNYVEGQAQIDRRSVRNSDVGTADVRDGQIIETRAGKAEILLTPGVFLRLGDNSSIRMDSSSLIDTRVALLSGRAMIEADNLQKGNSIRILDDGAVGRVEKNGIYAFAATPGTMSTLDGKLDVTRDDQSVEVGKGHEVTLQTPMQAVKFDKHAEENDPLYQWSKVRSQYLAESNINTSRVLVGGSGWYGSGWYWDPWFGMYSWIPGDGIFCSPFGWGFYSPFSVWQAPIIVYGRPGIGRGFAGRGFVGGVHSPAFRGGVRAPAFSGGVGHAVGRHR